MLNKTSRILVITGLLLSILGGRLIGSSWFDIAGYSIILVGIVTSKDSIVDSNEAYGKYIYYAILGVFLFLVYLKWF